MMRKNKTSSLQIKNCLKKEKKVGNVFNRSISMHLKAMSYCPVTLKQ